MMYQPPPGSQQVVVMKAQKSASVAFVLAFFFGPLGMLYSTVSGALTIFLIDLVLGLVDVFTLGIGTIFYVIPWIVGMIWAMNAVNAHNRTIVVTPAAPVIVNQSVIMPQAPMPPYGAYQQSGYMPNPYQQAGPYQQPGPMPNPYQGQSGPYQQPGSIPNPYQGQSGPYQQPAPTPNPYQEQSGPYQQPGSTPNPYGQPPEYPPAY